jgi:hypothetical protein
MQRLRSTQTWCKYYGPKFQVCIYTGQVTKISANGQTFCHNINTFEGCSGAIIFLLDRNQYDDVAAEFHGRAFGINVGGLDMDSNFGFLINKNSLSVKESRDKSDILSTRLPRDYE